MCAFNTACFKDKLGGKVPDWFSQKNLVEATRFSARKKLHGRLTAINSKARKEKKTPGNKKPTAATVEQHAVADQLRVDEWTASIISEENSVNSKWCGQEMRRVEVPRHENSQFVDAILVALGIPPVTIIISHPSLCLLGMLG